jgi:hypothetical protein
VHVRYRRQRIRAVLSGTALLALLTTAIVVAAMIASARGDETARERATALSRQLATQSLTLAQSDPAPPANSPPPPGAPRRRRRPATL